MLAIFLLVFAKLSLGYTLNFKGNCSTDILQLVSKPFLSIDDAFDRLYCLNQLFCRNNDRRCDFVTVYSETTYWIRYNIRETNLFHNKAWMERYTTAFADIYRLANDVFHLFQREAVYNDTIGNPIPEAWKLAFRHAEKKDLLILQNVALGINAHINGDLPFALFRVLFFCHVTAGRNRQ